MPQRTAPSVPGAHAFKTLLLRIDKAQRTSIARTGEIDILTAAGALDGCLRDAALRRGIILALAEMICTNLDGSAIDVHHWTPLAHFPEVTESNRKAK